MSLERPNDREKAPNLKTDILKAAALGGAILGTGALGVESGARNTLERVNSHVLSPGAIVKLQNETGATDSEIAKLEATLKPLLVQELKRLRSSR